MRTNVGNIPHKVIGCYYQDLIAMDLEWGRYVPLVDPVHLRLITVVHLDDPSVPDPWVLANVENGHLTHIGDAGAKDVAVLRRALRTREEEVTKK